MSEENTDTTIDPALTAGDPPPADPPQPETPAEPQPRMIPADVLVREVTPLRAKNRELESALDEHRRRLREADELITRLQKPGDAPPAAAPRQADPQAPAQSDIERAAAELNFKRDAGRVFTAGASTYGQKGFQDACNLMESFGLNNPEFVGSIMEIGGIEKTHEIFHAIAQEPEKVAALAGMTAVQRAREITRIADKMTAKPAAAAAEPPKAPARTVSRAPDPPPRTDHAASAVVDWRSDKASDDDFSKGWEENMARRRGARR